MPNIYTAPKTVYQSMQGKPSISRPLIKAKEMVYGQIFIMKLYTQRSAFLRLFNHVLQAKYPILLGTRSLQCCRKQYQKFKAFGRIKIKYYSLGSIFKKEIKKQKQISLLQLDFGKPNTVLKIPCHSLQNFIQIF